MLGVPNGISVCTGRVQCSVDDVRNVTPLKVNSLRDVAAIHRDNF